MTGDELKNARARIGRRPVAECCAGCSNNARNHGSEYLRTIVLTIADTKAFVCLRGLPLGKLDHSRTDLLDQVAPKLNAYGASTAFRRSLNTIRASAQCGKASGQKNDRPGQGTANGCSAGRRCSFFLTSGLALSRVNRHDITARNSGSGRVRNQTVHSHRVELAAIEQALTFNPNSTHGRSGNGNNAQIGI